MLFDWLLINITSRTSAKQSDRKIRGKKMAEKKTVLFVDDDEEILRSLERGLLDESYNKLFAKSGKEALETLKRTKVHAIVTDMLMPEMSGLPALICWATSRATAG